MLVVHVDIWVKAGEKEGFVEATKMNVELSRLEPGVAAFELHVDPTDDSHFLLVEIYRDGRAPVAHKEARHYQSWRETVEPMMKQPRQSTRWESLDTLLR